MIKSAKASDYFVGTGVDASWSNVELAGFDDIIALGKHPGTGNIVVY